MIVAVTQICDDDDNPIEVVQNTLKTYLQRDPWSSLLFSNTKGANSNRVPWHAYRPVVKQRYPGLLGLITFDIAMLAEMTPEEVDKELPVIFQTSAKVALKHVVDSLARRSCGFSGSVENIGTLVWSTGAKRMEALKAVGALMQESGMIVDWGEPDTWMPYARALCGIVEDKYTWDDEFGLRNAIETEMGLPCTQNEKDQWDTKEDVDHRFLCEILLQDHDSTECRDDEWRSLHGCNEGGPMSYIPVAFTGWHSPAKVSDQRKWLQEMWNGDASTAADYWVYRFIRLGVDKQTREDNHWEGKPTQPKITSLSYHTFLGLEAACTRILADVYAERLALLILAARHDHSCALSTHFPALQFEGCKPFVKLIASFLTRRLPVVDDDAMVKAKFFGTRKKEDSASKADWDAGCQPSVVYGAKTFIQALVKKDDWSISLDVAALLRPLLTPFVTELHLNRLRFVNDKHLDEAIFATGQQWPNLLVLDLSRTSVTADHVITRVCGPLAVGGATQVPAADLPFPNLTRLNLRALGAGVSVVGMRQLGATALVSLVHLHLSGVTGNSLREMCSRAPNRFLTLDLAGTRVQDITCLAETQKNLQHLNLSRCCVNAVGE